MGSTKYSRNPEYATTPFHTRPLSNEMKSNCIYREKMENDSVSVQLHITCGAGEEHSERARIQFEIGMKFSKQRSCKLRSTCYVSVKYLLKDASSANKCQTRASSGHFVCLNLRKNSKLVRKDLTVTYVFYCFLWTKDEVSSLEKERNNFCSYCHSRAAHGNCPIIRMCNCS